MTDDMVERAMKVMDDGYLEQDYYRTLRAKIKLEGNKRETFTYANYSWTEHISRKWGQWMNELDEVLDQLDASGFSLRRDRPSASAPASVAPHDQAGNAADDGNTPGLAQENRKGSQ